ncbi:hypothetical protein HMPREF0863_02448 [Erysipelotrichaceae bacterium 5_2_54FAA]|nr:hypothetical protein HMPREF0863_02448 [Erysipelotrichaceae bacterium 5_2_54FAA]
MGIFDVNAKLKKKAESVTNFKNEVKENGLGTVTKDRVKGVKNSINDSIEAKKADAELAQQKKEEFKVNQEELRKVFVSTQKMGDIEIDEVNKLLKFNNASSNIKKNNAMKLLGKGVLAMYTLGASIAVEMALKPGDIIFRYDEIRDYDLLENDVSVESGGLGRAIAGDVLAGPVGGLFGSLTAKRKTRKSIDMMALQISTTNFCFPSIMISYLTNETKTKSTRYTNALSQARNTIACLNLIFSQCDNSETQQIQQNSNDPYEELKKAKELLDMGIISQEEFEVKKKQLLEL